METFILGVVVGLLASPTLRSWIVWREHQLASREAWLAEETSGGSRRGKTHPVSPPEIA